MKNLNRFIATISFVSLSLLSLRFSPITLATNSSAVKSKTIHQSSTLIAKDIFCRVVNIRTGQLALRNSRGESIAGLNNGNTVEVLDYDDGGSAYVRVVNGPNSRVDGKTGWVNSNYLSCWTVDS